MALEDSARVVRHDLELPGTPARSNGRVSGTPGPTGDATDAEHHRPPRPLAHYPSPAIDRDEAEHGLSTSFGSPDRTQAVEKTPPRTLANTLFNIQLKGSEGAEMRYREQSKVRLARSFKGMGNDDNDTDEEEEDATFNSDSGGGGGGGGGATLQRSSTQTLRHKGKPPAWYESPKAPGWVRQLAENAREWDMKGVMHEDTPFSRRWDILTSILLVFVAIVTPFELGRAGP